MSLNTPLDLALVTSATTAGAPALPSNMSTNANGTYSPPEPFYIAELLENILLCSLPKDVIKFRRVSKFWNDCIGGSFALQKHTFRIAEKQTVDNRFCTSPSARTTDADCWNRFGTVPKSVFREERLHPVLHDLCLEEHFWLGCGDDEEPTLSLCLGRLFQEVTPGKSMPRLSYVLNLVDFIAGLPSRARMQAHHPERERSQYRDNDAAAADRWDKTVMTRPRCTTFRLCFQKNRQIISVKNDDGVTIYDFAAVVLQACLSATRVFRKQAQWEYIYLEIAVSDAQQRWGINDELADDSIEEDINFYHYTPTDPLGSNLLVKTE